MTDERRVGGWLAFALLATFLLRLAALDQPIWEGYIGRQVPTAMVARNLLRDGEFLSPKLDTGPFPSLFLVEPPIYAGLVALIVRCTGLPLEPSGRLVSALATTLGAWGLFGLARRREGWFAGLVCVTFFSLFPVMIRYGRAFQPDALMVGLTVAGLRCWDDRRPVAGWVLMAVGLTTKVTGAFILVPFAIVRLEGDGRGSGPKLARSRSMLIALSLAATMLIPAAAWYLHASQRLGEASASAGNAANWWGRISGFAAASWRTIGRDLTLRAFTPIGLALVAVGLGGWRRLDSLWRWWAVSAGLALAVLAGKLHHEYYWMMAAPVFAVLATLGWVRLGKIHRGLATVVFLVFVVLAFVQTRSTWSTPAEWTNLRVAGREIRENTTAEELVIAPEALTYSADRRGCRFEWEPSAVRRAAAEWKSRLEGSEATPESLVNLYRGVAGVSLFADLRASDLAPARSRLHEALRRSPDARVLVDRPGGLLLIRFTGPNVAEGRLREGMSDGRSR